MKSAIKGKTVKPPFNTIWSARSDATRVLKKNFVELRKLLQDFTLDDNETKTDSSHLKEYRCLRNSHIMCFMAPNSSKVSQYKQKFTASWHVIRKLRSVIYSLA